MAEPIIFNSIVANGMETNSAVFIGANTANNWDSHNKNQLGIGFVFGVYNTFPANFIPISDNDIIDTPIADGDIYRTLGTDQI